LTAATSGDVNFGGGPIYTSTNAGLTWASANVPSLQTASGASVASSADGTKVVVAARVDGIYTWHATPAPTLSVTRSGASLLIAWLVPSANFALEQSPDIAPGTWVAADGEPTLNYTNLHYEVDLPAPTGPMFYRLRSQ
jgi:hypothetical protein